MSLRNRVTPMGDLVAGPARGLVYGNRGCLHDGQGRIRRFSATRRWIACRLEFKGWQRGPMQQPGRFTELFFLDEATAMAAGHRACALCRRADYDRVRAIWAGLHPAQRGADAIDLQLDGERLEAPGVRRLHAAPLDELPDGAFVARDREPWLVSGDRLLHWTPGGYDHAVARPPAQPARLITPPSLVEVLRAGWGGAVPLVHDSAAKFRGVP
ncbi:MAG TPA: hypothetical protein VEX39_05605 [Thermoleophilaceae bacterium]|nr:hypothetical protein [Thermoleophilaceae bacterium]